MTTDSNIAPGGEHQARESIRRLLSLYCDSVARRDADAVGLLFTEDARVRIAGGAERIGRSAIVEGLRGTISQFGFLHQKCDTGLIDVAGDTARSRIGVMEMNQASGASEFNMIFGVYEDEYRLTGEGWRFARRDFTFQYRAILPAAETRHFQEFRPAYPFAP